MSNTYVAGSLVHVTGSFTNAAGVLTDPTVVTFKYAATGKATVTVAAVRDGTGLYHVDIDTTGFGTTTVNYEWFGTGAVQASNDGTFFVRQPAV